MKLVLPSTKCPVSGANMGRETPTQEGLKTEKEVLKGKEFLAAVPLLLSPLGREAGDRWKLNFHWKSL